MSRMERLFYAGLVFACFVLFLAFSTTAGMRQFYLTPGTFDGASAPTACGAGYHMANFYELHEPSVLHYNTALGYNLPAGSDWTGGPPPEATGWMREGIGPGPSNCDAYTTNSSSLKGNAFWLPEGDLGIAANGSSRFSQPWLVNPYACSALTHVWCVQN